jgi:hypothetical protein
VTAPAAAPPRYRVQNIPAELKALDRWITFAVSPGRGGKLAKLPYTPGTQNKARSNDPATWTTFDAALADAERTGRFLGFCFDPSLGYVFLDFDEVLGAGGAVKQYAAAVIDAFDSYSEVSAGGTGVHVFVRGSLPEGFTKDAIGGKVEVYPQAGGRFCLVTGDTRPGLGSLDGIIEERTAELARLFPPRPRAVPAPVPAKNGAHALALTDGDLEAVVAAVEPYWTLGQKHDLGVALGGMLAHNGVPEDQALAIVERLSAGDQRPGDRVKAVRDSYRRVAAGLDVKGYDALRELMPEDARAIVDGILSRVWHAHQPKLVTPGRVIKLQPARGDADAGDVDRWPEPPPEVYHGWFGGYLELVRETTEAPDQFHLAAALTIVGAFAGRNQFTRHASGRIFPNLYTVLVGLSGESKKDTAINRACEMVIDPPFVRERTAPPYVEKFGVASAESFVKGLSTNSNVLIRMSEFSEILANARRKGTTTILTMLMKAWDAPPQLSNDSIQNPAIAFNPYVSLLAGTQPDVLAADLAATDITSGFANRIFFVPGSGKGRMAWPQEVDEKALHEHWLKAKRNLAKFSLGERIDVDRGDPRVVELWDAFYDRPRGDSTIERTMSQRHQNMVLKIALIFALTDCWKLITYEHLCRAIAFLDWQWACLRQIIPGWANSKENKLEDLMMRVLRHDGAMRRRDLWPRVKRRDWNYNDYSRLLDNMIRQGTLAVDQEGNVGIPADD